MLSSLNAVSNLSRLSHWTFITQCNLIVFTAIAIVVWLQPTQKVAAQDEKPDEPSAIGELTDEEQQQVKTAERFLSVLEKNPRRGTALDRVYGHHVEFGTLDKFIASLRQRVEKTPQDGAIWMLIGLFESQRGSDADAVEAYVKAEQLRQQDPIASYYLGLAQLRLGDSVTAAQSLERAIERKPQRADQLEIFQTLGRIHQRAQRTQEALQVWQRLEKLFPGDARVLEQIAVTLVEENQAAEALPRYAKLAELVTDDYRRVTFRITQAELTIKTGKKPDGIKAFEAILANLNPDSWLYRDVRRRIDDVFLRSGDQDGLVKYYQAWLESHSEDVEGMSRLARFLSSAARVPEAIVWLEKAIKLAPSRTDLRKTFIDLLAGEQRFEDASKQYQELLRAAPNNPDYLREWGKLVMRNRERSEDQRREEAFGIWNRMIDPNAKDAVTVSQVADLCRQNQLNEKAEQLYLRAIEIAPNDPQYREYLGEFLHVQKRTDEAMRVWSEIAAGNRRNATNLARLAEVFNSFGFAEQACLQISEAVKLDAKDFSLLLKSADYHTKAGRHEEALAMCDQAQRLVANEDEREEVIKQRINVLQANQQLESESARRLAEYKKPDAKPNFDSWYEVGRYFESNRRWIEASDAIAEALKQQPKSIQALTTLARIAEGSGDFGKAADINRQLAEVDRRSLGDHLANVSRLEAQLGRAKEALEAAQKLIIAAPSKTENYEFYAQTCFRLGKPEEGLAALRKAMRINPNEPSLMRSLASALSDQMRTEEAIEVYWRAFDKSDEVDDKTTITQRLAPLYQMINQTDKLFERLERGRQEEESRRTFTVCIAQAWQTLGDLSAARKELESLLGENTRDTNLLNQLSKLCESDGDIESAINYQRQLVAIAPGDETESPLASMLVRNGRFDEAKEIFLRLIQREEDPVRQLRSIDSLLTNGNFDSAIQIIEPLLEKRRDDWELLYRQGMAWASLNNVAEAKSRFDRLLAVTLPYDTLGRASEARLKQAQAKAKSDNLRGVQTALPQRETPLAMLSKSSQVNQATGYTNNNAYYPPGTIQPVWMPDAYGVARMAAFSWLMKFEQDALQKLANATTENDKGEKVSDGKGSVAAEPDKENQKSDKETGIAERIRARAESDTAQRNDVLDWLYISQLRSDYAAIFNTAKRIAKSGGKEEQRFLLANLKLRDSRVDEYSNQVSSGGKPLTDEDLSLVEQCFQALTNNEKDVDLTAMYGSNIAFGSNGQVYVLVGSSYQMLPGVFRNNSGFVSLMVEEYRKAGKTEQATQLIDRQIAQAKTAAQLASSLALLFEEKRFDELLPLLDRWQEAALKQIAETPIVTVRNRNNANSTATVLSSVSNIVQRMMAAATTEEDTARIIALLEKVLPVALAHSRHQIMVNSAQAKPTTTTSSNAGATSITIYSGGKQNSVSLSFPPQNTHVDLITITLLRQAHDSLTPLGSAVELIKFFNEKLRSASPEHATFYTWCLASLHWWNEELDEAMVKVNQIARIEKQDVGFQFMLANLHQSRNELDEALNILQKITARDQPSILRREMGIMNLAERMGDLDRAREAAQKVFGLRTDSQTQQGLIAQMQRLGLTDYADAMTARLERTAGRQVESQLSLMNLLYAQGKADQAIQVANSVLRKTVSPYSAINAKNARNPLRYTTSDSRSRQSALQLLTRAGALKPMVAQLKEQLERTPNSVKILEQLIEFSTTLNQKEDSIKFLEELAKLRPEAAFYQLQLANIYSRSNKHSEACEYYIAVLKTNPRLLSESFREVDQTFVQAKRRKEFIELITNLDIRGIEPYYLMDTASNLLNDPNSTDIAVRLIEKVISSNPSYRRYAISNLGSEHALKNEKVYRIFKKTTLPTPATIKANPWFGVDEVRSYAGEGRVNSMMHDALSSIRSTPFYADFESSLKKLVEENPDWLGGAAVLAVQDIQNGRRSVGIEKLQSLLDPKKKLETIPSAVCWIIGQELAEYEQTQAQAIELLEYAQKSSTSMNEPTYQPMAMLISLYSKMPDKKETGIKYLRSQLVASNNSSNSGNIQYSAYSKVQAQLWIASKLEQLGKPAESVAVLRTLMNEPSLLSEADNWNGGRNSMMQRIEKAIESSMTSIGKTDAKVVLEDLLPDNQKAKLDLWISRPTAKDLEAKSMSSGLIDMLSNVASSASNKQLVSQRFEQLRQLRSEDSTIAIAELLWELKIDNVTTEQFSERAEKLLSSMQLATVEPGYKVSLRNRKDALPVTNLWLVAKRALESKVIDPVVKLRMADRLAERALEAAKRQTTSDFTVPILFEWGKLQAEQGDLAKAETLWDQLLTIVTTQVVARPVDANVDSPFDRPPASVPPAAAVPNQALVGPNTNAGKSAPSNGNATAGDPRVKPIAPLTVSQYQVVMKICKLSAKYGMKQLAAKALSRSLKGGMPVPDLNIGTDSSDPFSSRVTRSSSRSTSPESVVSSSLQETVAVLADMDAHAGQLYEILKGLVLPTDRPTEVRLYMNPISDAAANECLGSMLVNIAEKAGQLDDLAAVVRSRTPNQGNLPAKQLLTALVALRKNDIQATADVLDQLNKVAANSPANMQIALIAANRAFVEDTLKDAAIPILKQSTNYSGLALNADPSSGNSMETVQNTKWFKDMALKLQKYYLSKGMEEEAKQIFENRLVERQKFYARYSSSPDYVSYQQKNDLLVIAKDAFELGMKDYAFESWGRSCEIDASNWGGSEAIAGQLAELAIAWTKQLATDKQYDLWYQWTMPSEDRKTIRTAFSSSRGRTGTTPALQSNLIELVDVAASVGKLDQLESEVAKSNADQIDSAKYLQSLIAIKKDDVATTLQTIETMLADLKEKSQNIENLNRNRDIRPDVVILQEALRNPKISSSLLPLFPRVKRQLAMHDYDSVVSLLDWQALKSWGGIESVQVDFKHWLLGSSPYQNSSMQLWSAEANQIWHILNDQSSSMMYFKYPLQGSFKISLDVPELLKYSSSAGFGGLSIDMSSGQLSSPSSGDLVNGSGGFPPSPQTSIRFNVDGDRVKYSLGDNEFYNDQFTKTFPWLTLNASGSQIASWQKIQFEGEVTIPRQVFLIQDQFMDGWVTSSFGETQKRHRLLQQKPTSENDYIFQMKQNEPSSYDWTVKDGLLTGRSSVNEESNSQSWIYYARPLLEQESVTYEFFYQPEKIAIHPTIGRHAFLLEADGVRTRLISRNEMEATLIGVAMDNSTLERNNQRHSGKLSLNADQWNKVELKNTGSTIQLSLNGSMVFECPIESNWKTNFGLYRSKKLEARVKDVTLSGPWPEKLDQSVLADLYKIERGIPESAQATVDLISNDMVGRVNMDEVLLQAKLQAPEKAYELLCTWVLPANSQKIRLYSTATQSSSDSDSRMPAAVYGKPWYTIQSPVLELAKSAKQLGRTEELLKQIELKQIEFKQQKNSSLARQATALRTIVLLESGQADLAKTLLEKMALDPKEFSPDTELDLEFAPEFLSAWRALRSPETQTAALDLAKRINAVLSDKPYSAVPEREGFQAQVESLLGDAKLVNDFGKEQLPPPLKQWAQVPYLNQGFFEEKRSSTWVGTKGNLQHYAAETWSLNFFQSPLRGKFEITADCTVVGKDAIGISYAMHTAMPKEDLQGVTVISRIGNSEDSGGPVDLPGVKDKGTGQYRVQVDGNTVTTSINGVQIYQRTFAHTPDPWVAVHAIDSGAMGKIENLRISGQPEIPQQIDLIAVKELSCWRVYGAYATSNSYAHDPFSGESNQRSSTLNFSQEMLSINPVPEKKAPKQEVYIQYQRPILEDGVIEYEFLYESGIAEVHPMLAGQAIILQQDKVPSIHNLTTYSKNSSKLHLDNVTPLEGTQPIKLNESNWNQVRMEVKGSELTISLNGAAIAKLPVLVPQNQRHFGLFKYSNSLAQVRKLTYAGQWPTTLPSVEQQELATGP